jgi:hypothetical protein
MKSQKENIRNGGFGFKKNINATTNYAAAHIHQRSL